MIVRLRLLLLAGLATSLFCLAGRADEVPIQWGTTGTFSGTHQGLTYSSGSGGVVYTSGGVLSNLDLGTFTLTPFNGSFTGQFTLDITFVRPDVTYGNDVYLTQYVGLSTILGDVALLNFDNSWRTFSINGPDGVGSFQFRIVPTSGISIDPEIDVYITCLFGSDTSDTLRGEIRYASLTPPSVPEPASMPILWVAVSVLGLFLRRRA